MESEITPSSVWLFWWVGAQTPLNITAVHLVPERSFINKTVIDSSTKGGPKKGQIEFSPAVYILKMHRLQIFQSKHTSGCFDTRKHYTTVFLCAHTGSTLELICLSHVYF